MHPSPTEDQPYFESLRKNTQAASVYEDFETKFLVTATYLSPQFQQAFANRLSFLYFDQQTALSETEGKAAFFVSLHAPENRLSELTNKQLWSVGLDSSEAETTLEPVLLRHLADKERLAGLFSCRQ